MDLFSGVSYKRWRFLLQVRVPWSVCLSVGRSVWLLVTIVFFGITAKAIVMAFGVDPIKEWRATWGGHILSQRGKFG